MGNTFFVIGLLFSSVLTFLVAFYNDPVFVSICGRFFIELAKIF